MYEWSYHGRRHMTLKGQGRHPDIFMGSYLENSSR